MSRLQVEALEPLPEVRPGDDLAALLLAAGASRLGCGDLLVIAHKVVSKAEGAIADLASVTPSARAL